MECSGVKILKLKSGKWKVELTNDIFITNMQIFTMEGLLKESINNVNKTKVNFDIMPGNYLLVVNTLLGIFSTNIKFS